MSRAIYLPTQEKPKTSKTNPQTETLPLHPGGDPTSRVTFARNMESSLQWWFLRFPVARRGRCHSGISSGLGEHKSRVLSPPCWGIIQTTSFFGFQKIKDYKVYLWTVNSETKTYTYCISNINVFIIIIIYSLKIIQKLTAIVQASRTKRRKVL